MAYSRKPNYHFQLETDTGLDKIPVGRHVICKDVLGSTLEMTYTNNTGVTAASTVRDGINNDNLSVNKLDIKSNLFYTVPTDFATINEGINLIKRLYNPSSEYIVTLNLATGFVMAEQVKVKNENLGWIKITATDALTTITRSALSSAWNHGDGYNRFDAFSVDNGTLPIIGCQFQMNTSGTATERSGVTLWNNSFGVVMPNCGVNNSGQFGLLVTNSSSCFAKEAVFKDSVSTNVTSNVDSSIRFDSGTTTGSVNGYGLLSENGSHIYADSVTATSNTLDDLYVRYNSTIYFRGTSTYGNSNIIVNTIQPAGLEALCYIWK